MKQHRRAECGEQHREAELQEGLIGQRPGKGPQKLHPGKAQGEQHGTVDRAERKTAAKENETYEQKQRIDDEHQGARCEHGGWKQAPQDQGQAADASG